jgi:trehalose 6-phosphate phosphatase
VTELNRSLLYSRVDQAIGSGRRLLVATDFDGTLAPIAATPNEAALPAGTWRTLREMAALPGCLLFVVSGRSLADLKRRCTCPAILAGNHGLEIEGGGLSFEHDGAVRLLSLLEDACVDLDTVLKRWPGAFVERKRLTATVHFRNVHEREQHAVVLAVRARMRSYGLTFGLRAGKRALEVHPRVSWNKGAAVNWVREQLGLQDACCVCIGDDRTDESMFESCAPAVTVAVGPLRRTAAEHTVRDPAEVCSLLSYITGRLATAGNEDERQGMRSATVSA